MVTWYVQYTGKFDSNIFSTVKESNIRSKDEWIKWLENVGLKVVATFKVTLK